MVSEYGNIQNAFTKEGAGVSFFFLLEGGWGGYFPRSRFIKAIISIHVHCTVVHLSPFEVPDFQCFLSRLPKLTPWKSRLPKFEN